MLVQFGKCPRKSDGCVRCTKAFLFSIEGGNEQVMTFGNMQKQKATSLFAVRASCQQRIYPQLHLLLIYTKKGHRCLRLNVFLWLKAAYSQLVLQYFFLGALINAIGNPKIPASCSPKIGYSASPWKKLVKSSEESGSLIYSWLKTVLQWIVPSLGWQPRVTSQVVGS